MVSDLLKWYFKGLHKSCSGQKVDCFLSFSVHKNEDRLRSDNMFLERQLGL